MRGFAKSLMNCNVCYHSIISEAKWLNRKNWVVESLLFAYRRQVTVTEQSGNDLTDYQVLIELNSSNFDFSHANEDGSDIRFYDGNNLYPYWIEKWDSANQEAKIWVKVPNILANGTTFFYMYYGNPDITSASDINSTFIRIIDGLVGAWHFDEGEGTIAYDSSGNGNHGTIYGATWTDGKFGKALSFDGSDDYVDCGNDASLDMDITGSFTIEAWVKLNGLTGDYQVIAGRWYDGETADQSYGLQFRSNSSIPGVIVYDISETGCYSPEGIDFDQWYHIVGLYDGSYLRVYVNNTQKNSCSYSGNIANTNAPFTIGRWTKSDDKNPFYGTIDEVRIYNQALTPEEISDLYNNYGYTTTNYPGKVLVRKYTDPEPSVSIGSEETP